MSRTGSDSRRRALAVATFLVTAGALSGIAIDRLLLLPGTAAAAEPLTARAMADQLGLDAGDEARITSLLDSLHAEVLDAARLGPDSLLATTRAVHDRLELALPAETRPRFREWVRAHHDRIMDRLESGPAHGHIPWFH